MKSKLSSILVVIFTIQSMIGVSVHAEAEAAKANESALSIENIYKNEWPDTISAERRKELQKMMDEKPYSLLMQKEMPCHGKEKLMDSFILKPTQSGSRGSLTKNENIFGERSFDFEGMQDAIFNAEQDESSRSCLLQYASVAFREWTNYFEDRSEHFECGLVFKPPTNENPAIRVEIDPSKKKTNMCDMDHEGEKYSDWLKKHMEKLAQVHKRFSDKFEDAYKKMEAAEAAQTPEQANREKTAASVCNEPGKCTGQSKEATDSAFIKDFNERACCERIHAKWESLGFTTSKDAKPNDRICHDMINKDNDMGYCESRYCLKDAGNCLLNFAAAFQRDFFQSVIDSWKFWAWGSQLWTLLNEMISNPGEVMKNIVTNLLGGEREYAACLNKKSMFQYGCQMIGKFFGSSAGFSAGLGAFVGLVRGVGKGILAKSTKVVNSPELVKRFALDPKTGILKTAGKEAMVSARRGFAAGMVWPWEVTKGAGAVVGFTGRALWNNTGVGFILSRAKSGTASLAVDALGRASSAAGSVAKKTGWGAIGSDMQQLGKDLRDKAKDISERSKTSSSKITSKAAGELKAAQSVLKNIDDSIAGEAERFKTFFKDNKIRVRKDGSPIISRGTTKDVLYVDLKTEFKTLRKQREEVVKSISDMKAKGDLKRWNILKSTLIIGPGTLGNRYIVNDGKVPDQVAPEDRNNPGANSGIEGGIGTGKALQKADPARGENKSGQQGEAKGPVDAVAPKAAEGVSSEGTSVTPELQQRRSEPNASKAPQERQLAPSSEGSALPPAPPD